MRVIEVKEVEIDKIRVPEWNRRTIVSDQEVNEIASSIKSNILIEPVVVRKLDDGGYELISGFMRFNALKSLGRETIEAKIIECSDEEGLTISLDENLKRSNMHPFDIAKKIEYMYRSLGLSVREIGRRLNRDESWVSMMLSIGSLCDEVKKILAPKVRDIPTLYEISRLKDPKGQELASRIIAEYDLSRTMASKLVKEIMEKGYEAVEREYNRILEESKDMGGRGLYDSEEFNMLNASNKSKALMEAQDYRTCDICGERRPKEDVKFIAICRDKHDAFHDMIKLYRKYGSENGDKRMMHVLEIANITKGLDIEELREYAEKAKVHRAKS